MGTTSPPQPTPAQKSVVMANCLITSVMMATSWMAMDAQKTASLKMDGVVKSLSQDQRRCVSWKQLWQ